MEYLHLKDGALGSDVLLEAATDGLLGLDGDGV